MTEHPEEKVDWRGIVSVSLKIALVLAALYLGGDYLRRIWRTPLEREDTSKIKLHEDLYVHPPKSYISSFETAGKLVGMDLWVMEGCRWPYEPGDRRFNPIEKVTPTRLFRQGEEVWIEFLADGKPARFRIGAAGRIFVDEVFYFKDPRQLYEHWSDEDWRKIEAHQLSEGMSEIQATFALGMGAVARQSGSTRVVDFSACEALGISPVRVTFREGVADSIEPL